MAFLSMIIQKNVQQMDFAEGSIARHRATLKHFNVEVEKKKIVEKFVSKIDLSTNANMFTRSFTLD